MALIGNIDNSDIESVIAAVNQLAEDVNAIDVPTALADLSEDSTHRLVTDIEKTGWNNKADQSFSVAMAVAL